MASPFGLFINNLIFRYADDSSATEDKARVLIWRELFAAGDHESQRAPSVIPLIFSVLYIISVSSSRLWPSPTFPSACGQCVSMNFSWHIFTLIRKSFLKTMYYANTMTEFVISALLFFWFNSCPNVIY